MHCFIISQSRFFKIEYVILLAIFNSTCLILKLKFFYILINQFFFVPEPNILQTQFFFNQINHNICV
jgi:hypothetical protein